MPTTWNAWTTRELDTLYAYWLTGCKVTSWAPDALPDRTVGTVRVTAFRIGLPPITEIRNGRGVYSLLRPVDVPMLTPAARRAILKARQVARARSILLAMLRNYDK